MQMTVKNYYKRVFAFFILSVFLAACSYDSPSKRDTPTQGIEKIIIDESYYNFMSSELFTFMSKYPDALMLEKFMPEEEAIQYLINDSVDVIVISRDLTTEEKEVFESKKIKARTVEIAKDAITFIVNRNNPDSIFTKKQMDLILSGKIKSWNELNNQRSNANFVLVLDNEKSANARYLKDTFIKSTNFPSTITVAGNNLNVFKVVSENPNAIGIISNGWISDRDDSTCNALLNMISLVAIKKDEQSKAFQPFQGYISSNEYPYTRKLYMINTEGSNGLATGFVSYVAGEKGQLIILKNGIVPAIVPSRSVKIDIEH